MWNVKCKIDFFQKLWYSFQGSGSAERKEDCDIRRMIINENFGKKNGYNVFKQLLRGTFTSTDCGKALELTVLTRDCSVVPVARYLVPLGGYRLHPPGGSRCGFFGKKAGGTRVLLLVPPQIADDNWVFATYFSWFFEILNLFPTL